MMAQASEEQLRAWMRFCAKVRVTGDGHWVWVGARDADGRPKFCEDGNQARSAARVAMTWATGPIPRGRYVRRDCGVALCVRPEHHHVGPRPPRLERKPGRAKLLAPVIRERVLLRGESRNAVSRDLGVNLSDVSRICARKMYADVG